MLTVISSPVPVKQEPDIINGLFESGLAVFHLRKPGSDIKMISNLLKAIHPQYHNRIALHAHHTLAEEFEIKRLHHSEQDRVKRSPVYAPGFIYSTSVHNLEEYREIHSVYSYTFLGPVFNSISKTNYKEMNHINHPINLKNRSIKIIGIGGITKSNGLKAMEYGFDGLALLGFLWLSERPLFQFKSIQNLWNIADQL